MADRAFLQQLSRKLADDGKLIEAGFVAMRLHAMPLDAPPDQVRAMRLAFMAGAQHTFSSLIGIMTEDREPTDEDLRRMDQIDQELRAVVKELEAAVKRRPDAPL